jgi:CRP/FNR family transcriptional regulator
MSKQIRHDEELMLLLGKRSAEEKLAGYLIGLSKRYASRNYSPTEFHLSMSRGDIGNYLGIAEETVCRILTRFREEKLITTFRRHIHLNDIKRLSTLADVDCIGCGAARSSNLRTAPSFPAA